MAGGCDGVLVGGHVLFSCTREYGACNDHPRWRCGLRLRPALVDRDCGCDLTNPRRLAARFPFAAPAAPSFGGSALSGGVTSSTHVSTSMIPVGRDCGSLTVSAFVGRDCDADSAASSSVGRDCDSELPVSSFVGRDCDADSPASSLVGCDCGSQPHSAASSANAIVNAFSQPFQS